jgi:very-short-patch-repair endonuclease
MLIPDAIVEIEGGGTVLLELDGRQHFGVVPHFHPNGEEDFKDQLDRDLRKHRECRRRGWSLLRIGYPLYKDIEQIVDQFIEDFIGGDREQLFRATPADLYNSVPRLI